MGRQIIKQPNGRYCVYSSIVDSIIYYNMTPEDIVNESVKEYKEEKEVEVEKIIRKLNDNKKPYFQFTLTFEDMLKNISEVHGKREAKKIKKLITNK